MNIACLLILCNSTAILPTGRWVIALTIYTSIHLPPLQSPWARIPPLQRLLGAVLIWRCHLTSIGIPMSKIRRSRDSHIFNMGIIPIPEKTVFIFRRGSGIYIDCVYVHDYTVYFQVFVAVLMVFSMVLLVGVASNGGMIISYFRFYKQLFCIKRQSNA